MAKQKNTFSDEIRRAILATSMSRNGMCRSLGIDPGSLSRFVNGKAGLELAAVDKIAKLLGLHVTTAGTAQVPAKTQGKAKG